jgi:hypothetical protein
MTINLVMAHDEVQKKKNDPAGEDRQQFTRLNWTGLVFSCETVISRQGREYRSRRTSIVGSRYLTSTGECYNRLGLRVKAL